MRFSLLQWNVSINSGIEAIANEIAKTNADICCLQEIFGKSINNVGQLYLMRRFPGRHHYYHPSHTWPTGEIQYNGFMSKLPIEAAAFRYVTQPPLKSVVTASTEGRVYLEAAIRMGAGRLIIGTTHLSYSRRFVVTKQRKDENESLLSIVRQRHKGFVLAGDLNSVPRSKLVSQLRKYLVHSGPEWNQNTFPAPMYQGGKIQTREPQVRLDYVFATPDVTVTSAQVLKSNYSDHLPLLLTMEYEP